MDDRDPERPAGEGPEGDDVRRDGDGPRRSGPAPGCPVGFATRYGLLALVTGASEGLGAAFAERIAARGVGLLLVARRPGPLDALAERLHAAHGVEVRTLAADLSREAGLAAVAEQAEGLPVGLFVHSAAVSPIGDFLEREADEHERLLAVNCRAPALLAHRLGKKMAERGQGGIVLLSSLASHQGSALVAHYAASKAYQRVLAEGLWAELRPRGVDVLACLAGPTETPTYRAGKPRPGSGLEWPPVMDATAVAEATLDALGKGPVVVPGLANKAVDVVMRRLLPGASAVRLVSASTRKMYRKP